jgi:hypothetical protein
MSYVPATLPFQIESNSVIDLLSSTSSPDDRPSGGV